MKCKMDFAFTIGDHVLITDTKNITGRICGMCNKSGIVSYQITYWNEGKRYDEWLLEWELEDVK